MLSCLGQGTTRGLRGNLYSIDFVFSSEFEENQVFCNVILLYNIALTQPKVRHWRSFFVNLAFLVGKKGFSYRRIAKPKIFYNASGWRRQWLFGSLFFKIYRCTGSFLLWSLYKIGVRCCFFLINISQEREENCRESDTFETLVASLRQSYHVSRLGRSMLSSSSTARKRFEILAIFSKLFAPLLRTDRFLIPEK